MIKYEEFKKRLEARGLTSSLIAIIMEELIEGIDIQVKNVELELQSGLFKIKNSNSSNARCNYIIEKNDKELDFMKYVSNIKVSDFDVRSLEPPEITLTVIPFDFNTNKNQEVLITKCNGPKSMGGKCTALNCFDC